MRTFIILSAILLTLSCGQGQSTKDETNAGNQSAITFPGDGLVLVKEGTTNEVMINKTYQTLEGKVAVYDDGIVSIVKNWETKSAADYQVLGAKKAELAKLDGKIVTAKGKISKTGAYSGTIEVESFELK
ncbi:MAG: hypothetical protein A2Y33_05930 [Spirochaetes bacterium GWF1_51_8]|nr:MAG: hypothetical protein A2Y33_05930 [Spirochaetes bacterium GWF1_51_8]